MSVKLRIAWFNWKLAMKQLNTASQGWRSTKTIFASGNRRWISGARAMWSGNLSITICPGPGGAIAASASK